MRFINDITMNNNKNDHEKNIKMINNEIDILLANKFKNCIPLIQNIIISDNISKYNQDTGYDISLNAKGTVHKIDNMFNIIFNYNKLITIENGRCYLDIITKNFIYHELCHIRDYIKYDKIIDKCAYELKLSEVDKYLGKKIFLEFNAQYKAQLYEPIVWYCNKYSLDTNIDKHHRNYESIMNQLKQLNSNNLAETKKNIEKLSNDIVYFSRDIMYDFSLSFGSNAADNRKNSGIKKIDIKVEGINKNIDDLLNTFIGGFNEVINDNKSILNYTLLNGSKILNYMLEKYQSKADIIDKEIN